MFNKYGVILFVIALISIAILTVSCAIKVDSPTSTNGECTPASSNQINTTLVKS